MTSLIKRSLITVSGAHMTILPNEKIFSIACYFIQKNKVENKGLTNKKLQKLLYYSQAWSLVLLNKKLFTDPIEAWVHGPAIKKVYEFFKGYGFQEIPSEFDDSCLASLKNDETKILDTIWDVYGKYDGNYLEVLSHSESPWQLARKGSEPFESSKNIISTDEMKAFYGKKLAETQS